MPQATPVKQRRAEADGPAAPEKPELVSKTHNSVTLQYVEGQEYSVTEAHGRKAVYLRTFAGSNTLSQPGSKKPQPIRHRLPVRYHRQDR